MVAFFVSQATTVQANTAHEAKVDALTKQYRANVEAYRSREREFTIAKQEYLQLETLASLENAVKATREVYRARTEVLAVYLELLQQILTAAEGVPPLEKQRTLEDIILKLEALQRHKASILQAQDKVAMAVLADQFQLLGEDVLVTVHRAQSMIMLGKFTIAYNQALAVNTMVKTELFSHNNNELERAELQRGFDEIDRTFAEIESSLSFIQASTIAEDAEYSAGFYNQLLSRLSEPYAGLRKVVSFLEELAAR